MNNTQSESGFKKQVTEQFETLLQNQNGSLPELKNLRKEAFDIFLSQDLPNTKQEDWKYTNVRSLLKQSYTLFDQGKIVQKDLENIKLYQLDAYKLVFVNGQFKEDLSSTVFEKDFIVSNIKSAWKNNSELLNKHLSKPAKGSPVFTSLNAALSQDGAFIYLGKSKVADKPVLILDITDTRENNIFSNPGSLVIASENSQLSLINENIVFGNQPHFKNNVTDVVVERDARVRHYKLQNLNEVASHIDTLNVKQADNSVFTDTSVSLKGSLIRNNINISLNGEHCETNMNGLFALNDKDHIDIKTSVDHIKPNSESNELYKGILNGHSTGVFNGKIYVRQDAQKTNAFQSNKNILLSENATINTKPQLEIWADDVKCSHGTTTGALDKEQMFYLRSRGIEEDKARALLIKAFASEVLDSISIDPLKEHIENLVTDKIENQ